MILPFDF